jgi:hypothetical protein
VGERRGEYRRVEEKRGKVRKQVNVLLQLHATLTQHYRLLSPDLK